MSETRGDVTGGGLAEVVLALADEWIENPVHSNSYGHALRTAVAAATAETPRGDDMEAQVRALREAAEEVHVNRFAHDDGKWGGPDNFYNGMLYARRLMHARADALAASPVAQGERGQG